MKIVYGAGRSTLMTLGLLGVMMALGCGRTTANEPGPIATAQSGNEIKSAASQGAKLPAGARVALEAEMSERFLRLENGDHVTRNGGAGAWEISGTERHGWGILRAEYGSEGFRFHQLGYQATRRPIGVAEKLDGIEECYDVVFTAAAVAYLGELKYGREDDEPNEKSVYESWWRNVTTESLDFPVLSVCYRQKKWQVMQGRFLTSFTSDIHPTDVADLNR